MAFKRNPFSLDQQAIASEAADAILAGYGDEASALLEAIPPSRSLIDKPSFKERFGAALERRQTARAKMQDEQRLASTLGALAGTVISPMSRVVSLPARAATSALEETGRGDVSGGLDFLKALAIGAGQGVLQHIAPSIQAGLRSRSAFKQSLKPLIDMATSNVSPGTERYLEEEQRLREQRARRQE